MCSRQHQSQSEALHRLPGDGDEEVNDPGPQLMLLSMDVNDLLYVGEINEQSCDLKRR